MPKQYKRTTINSGKNGGTRVTETRSSDGSIRVTYSSGPKWNRTTSSFKNGKVKDTRTSTVDGWTSRTQRTSGYRARGSRKSSFKINVILFVVFTVIYLIYQ